MTEPMPMPPPDKTNEVAQPRAKSKGEKFFDRAVYAGIAGVGTFIATIVLTEELKDGRLKWFHKGAANIAEKIANVVRSGKDNKKLAEEAALTTSLMMGGNLMLIPVGIAEQHKVALVDGLNAAMEDKTPKEDIQKAPKQTWMSLAKSRGVAWIAVFSTLKGLGHYYEKTMKSFEEQTGDLLCGIMKKSKPYDGLVVENGVTVFKKELETKTYRYGKLAALDVFATIGSATLLYLGGHFFARKQEERKELREERKHKLVNGEVLRDGAIEADAISASDAPSVQIEGIKQHEGTAREPQLAQQL